VDYDTVAKQYNRRYELHDYPGIRSAIRAVVERIDGNRVLEVGCGTGRWIAELSRTGLDVAGIDPSEQMLSQAREIVTGDLRRGVAEDLPWLEASFDAVLYINSLHHIVAPLVALRETFRVLRPGGRVLSIGLDPHEPGDQCYVYEFFPEALILDRQRFPSCARRMDWMRTAGFTEVALGVAEHLQSSRSFEQALADGVLERSFTSQLTAISDAQYAAGMGRLRSAVALDPEIRLTVSLTLYATEARKPV
jgi:SAM-dependent methyltransferase